MFANLVRTLGDDSLLAMRLLAPRSPPACQSHPCVNLQQEVLFPERDD